MNIAMIQSTPCPPEEGIGNYVFNLSSKLISRNHSVTVITRGGIRHEETTEQGIRIVRLPCPPVYPFHVDLHGVFVNRFLEQEPDQFDLIHAHTPLTPAIQTSTPLVSTIHTSVVEDVKHIHGWNLKNLTHKLTAAVSSTRLVAKQGNAADRVTTVSSRVKDELAEHYDIHDVTVARNGVDANEFHPNEEGDEQYLLFVGRLDHPKGVPDLIEAAEPIIKTHDIELIITGKGPQREQLERLSEQQGIAEDVIFTGYVSRERQIKLYQNATAFVLPSHYEGLPTVLLEAMSCGAPVIATEVGGCPDVIDDRVNGLLIPPKNPQAISEALDVLLRDDEMRTSLGTNARQTIIDRYTWEAIADVYEREYQIAREAR